MVPQTVSGQHSTRRLAVLSDTGQSPPLLLDTSVLTFLTDPRNPKPEWDDVIRGRTLVLSFVTVGEILHGTLSSRWSKQRIADVEARLGAYPSSPEPSVWPGSTPNSDGVLQAGWRE